ncbi:MAG: hypothetical protein EOM51_09875 [Clostridia bacterium]|nr:hypothetical protein [Clostridia bacterium]
MGKSRAAIDTITGYYYQFDYYILQLLELDADTDTVCIEGIEDVDINHLDETTAIQCKYYSKTEYNHSVIAKPIRLMLSNYKETLGSGKQLKYRIYGNYSSGQSKFPDVVDVAFAKEKLFTYTHDDTKHEHHIELGLTDEDIADFLTRLTIDINAISYEEQVKCVITKLKEVFSCCEYESEYYYYNSSLRLVKELATKQRVAERTITKREFISKIDNRNGLFDIWYLQFKGVKEYCQSVKAQYFSPKNVSPCERLFLIDCDERILDTEIKTLVLKIAKNWSKLSKREVSPFCPYIYLHNVSEQRVSNIKQALQNDDIYFLDGYDFKGATFSTKSIARRATAHNEITIKIITDLEQVDQILDAIPTSREIYQFFIKEHYYENSDHKHIFIQIQETKNISEII